MSKPKLYIIGGGMGDPALLTCRAEEILRNNHNILTTGRLGSSLPTAGPVRSLSVPEIREALAREGRDAVVAVSGDAGFYSLADTLCREFGAGYEVQVHSGISSLQYLCAKLRIPYHDVKSVSLHGRAGDPVAHVAYHPKVFALCGGENSAAQVLDRVRRAGLGHVEATVGQWLSTADERVETGTVEALAERAWEDPAVLLFCNHNPGKRAGRLRDGDFIRGGVPMTKEPVRVLAVERLGVEPGDVIYDIGAGTGSVSVALARRAFEGRVYAVERAGEALDLIRRNRVRFGAYNITPVEAEAPGGLEDLPPAQGVFLGGSGGKTRAIVEKLAEQRQGFRFCATAVTLESVAELHRCLKELGFAEIEVECINVARATAAGDYHLMRGENPVHLFSGRWPG